MADDENIENRFTTYWGGPCDDRAMEYAARHGISYDGGFVVQMGPGMFINMGGGNTDFEALRRANRASDAETRALHAHDTGISTGTSVSQVAGTNGSIAHAASSDARQKSAEYTLNILRRYLTGRSSCMAYWALHQERSRRQRSSLTLMRRFL